MLERDPREDKLPKWAQQKLDLLRVCVKEARDEVQTFSRPGKATGNPNSDNSIELGEDPHILFRIDGADVSVRIIRGNLYLNMHSLGAFRYIAFLPESANSGCIKAIEDK